MENENKIANEVEEVLNSIMDEINEEVAADEAVEETAEEVVEEAAEEVVEAEAEEVIEEEATEETADEETDNGILSKEIVTTKKIEPYGAATNSVVFGALGLLLPFVAMIFWVLQFRCFAAVTAVTALAFGIVALVTSFRANKFPATLSNQMSKAGRVFSIVALSFSSVSMIYMVATIIKEIIAATLVIVSILGVVLYGGAVAPQWIEALMPMIEEYMAAMGY